MIYRGPKQHEEDCALELLGRYEAERAATAPETRWLERQASRFIDEAETTAIVLGFIAQLEKAKEDDDETASDQLLRHVSRDYDVREMLTQRPLAGLAFGAAEYVWDKFNSPQQRFRTGLPAIDELTNGGLARGQVGVIAAGSGVGKSMALCDLAAEAARGGASVLYINCESEDYELQARIVTNLADMRNDRYRALDLEGLRAVHERCAKYKVVVQDLLTSARPTDLVKAVEEFRYKFGHHPDVIIVDYLNELEPAKEGKNDTSYSTVGKVGSSLLDSITNISTATRDSIRKQINPQALSLDAATAGLSLREHAARAAQTFARAAKAMEEARKLLRLPYVGLPVDHKSAGCLLLQTARLRRRLPRIANISHSRAAGRAESGDASKRPPARAKYRGFQKSEGGTLCHWQNR